MLYYILQAQLFLHPQPVLHRDQILSQSQKKTKKPISSSSARTSQRTQPRQPWQPMYVTHTSTHWLGHTVVNNLSRWGAVRCPLILLYFSTLQFAGCEVSTRCPYSHIILQTGPGCLPSPCFLLLIDHSFCASYLYNQTHHHLTISTYL